MNQYVLDSSASDFSAKCPLQFFGPGQMSAHQLAVLDLPDGEMGQTRVDCHFIVPLPGVPHPGIDMDPYVLPTTQCAEDIVYQVRAASGDAIADYAAIQGGTLLGEAGILLAEAPGQQGAVGRAGQSSPEVSFFSDRK